MSFPKVVAHLVVHRRKSLIAAVVLIVLACAWILRVQQRFDSEVLNLLPAQFESVQALKELNNNFTQARELTFALQGSPEVIAGFEEHFFEQLRVEPWVRRVLQGSPMETPEGLQVLQRLIPPLLLNLDAAAFAGALRQLEPDTIATRLQHLRGQIDAGSPRAEMELTTDPLGLLGAAMKPMASLYGMEKGQAMAAADGTLKVIPVVTNQASLSQPDCKALMQQVDAFRARVRQTWNGPAPEILVTGRSAYVAQISASMERDVQLTSTISILAVSGLFYLGFRRIMPLVGLTVILALSCFVAFSIGCLFFENLNMIAIAFCSILVGLGDDFSLLLYNRYLQARAAREDHETAIATSVGEVGKGIFYVSLTTGIGFLVLLFSGSAGFAQLGLLIAVGIVLCGLFMLLLLFLFIRPQHADDRPDPFRKIVERYVQWIVLHPAKLALPMVIFAAAVELFAISPFAQLRFDTSPRSLEPKGSPAAQALQTITQKIAAVSEPVVLIVRGENAQEAHDRWTALSAHLQGLVEAGELSGVSSPAALLLSPARLRSNQEALRALDLGASEAAFTGGLSANGFNPDAFAEGRELFAQLKRSQTGGAELLDFRALIPAESSWWFLIDRYFSDQPFVAAAYLKPARPLTSAAEQEALERRIKECGVPLRVTGWSYAMISLVPWAQHELIVFSTGVGSLIMLLLAFAYRAWRPWLIHGASLLFAVAATVSTLKLLGIRINMLNALAFPLVLGVGVDYGLHVLFAAREPGDQRTNLVTVLKPVIICGLTTMTGFGSLIFAQNPALSGLGLVCAIGVFWCLFSSILFTLPLFQLTRPITSPEPHTSSSEGV